MFENKKLYHVSQESGLKFLDPKYRSACWGGQLRGTYFFVEGYDAYGYMAGNFNLQYIYSTRVPIESIKYPDWRLDLFFSREILDYLPKYLMNVHKKDMDHHGFVPLNLNSQWGEKRDSYSRNCSNFIEHPVVIKGLEFKNENCSVVFQDKDEKELQRIGLSVGMDSYYIGLADTLIDYLCQKSENFTRHYNWELRREVKGKYRVGIPGNAVKYVGSKPIPVTEGVINTGLEKSIYWGCLFFCALGFMLMGTLVLEKGCASLPVKKSKSKQSTILIEKNSNRLFPKVR